MKVDAFKKRLKEYISNVRQSLSTDAGDWVVKGFIDVYRNIYTISLDTKVISKIIELVLIPLLARFAEIHKYKMILCEYQNHYPDVSFLSSGGSKIAVDLKSTYRVSENTVSGFTLGAFTGYFRQRSSTKNITFPYEEYDAHIVLGIIYSRRKEAIDEKQIYSLNEIDNIVSVIRDFTFLVNEKWQIASDKPGSGNTKNIGSIRNISDLINGNGPFVPYGKEVFDDYWMNYLTRDMADAIDSRVPYRNIEEYFEWKGLPEN